MITAIKEKAIVRENGIVEIFAVGLPVGTEVEVIVLVEEHEMDATEYLLSTEANREHLAKALRDAEDPTKRIYVDIENL